MPIDTSLKVEHVHHRRFSTREEARTAVFDHGDSVLGEVSMDTRMLRRTRGGRS
jgi:hypothetical protein